MNTKVRSFLIEKARDTRNETVHYQELCDKCGLGLDMSRDNHRAEIGRILGEISTYEHKKDRPLLSVLVVLSEGVSAGDGFFKLAEKLEFGSWNKLRDSDFSIIETAKCIDFWTNESKYLKNKDV